MLNSTEHEIYPAHVKMPTKVGILKFVSRINVGILTFVSRINAISAISKCYKHVNTVIFQYFIFYEQLKFHAQLS